VGVRIAAMPGRFEGKQALVLGVANRRSIAPAHA
jgi:enoyl-[acyl-carrier-protein] reductase (NADH)